MKKRIDFKVNSFFMCSTNYYLCYKMNCITNPTVMEELQIAIDTKDFQEYFKASIKKFLLPLNSSPI